MSEQDNKPANKITSGAVTAAIFANTLQRKDGSGSFVKYSVNVTRTFTRDDGASFEHTASIDSGNLDNMLIVVRAAKDWIAAQGE